MNIHSYMQEPIDTILDTTSAFKLLSDPTRYQILCLLIKHKRGRCVYEIAEDLHISHSAASHQLSKLEARDIVCRYREGQAMCYQMKNTPLTKNLKRVISIFES